MNLSKERLADAVIRKYGPEDRAAVRKICYDTGLMGDPIDPYFGCIELFADYWMTYYTDHSIIIAHPEPGGEWTLYPEVIEGDKRFLHAGQPARPLSMGPITLVEQYNITHSARGLRGW